MRLDKNACLRGNGIILVPFCRKYISNDYIGWLNDPEVCRYNRHGNARYTRAKAIAYLTSIQEDPNKVVFAILDKKTRAYLGNIGLYVERSDRSAEIAILLGAKKCWGRGIGTEAVRLVSQYAFGKLRLHRLCMGMMAENQGMVRIACKLGFRREGVLKDAMIKNGCFKDVTLWGKINRKDSRKKDAP